MHISWMTVFLSVLCGASLLAFAISFITSVRLGGSRLHLRFSAMCVTGAIYTFCTLMEYHTTSIETYVNFIRVQMFAVSFFITATILFTATYTGGKVTKPAAAFMALINLFMAVRLLHPTTLTFANPRGMKPFLLPWNEVLWLADADPTHWSASYYVLLLGLFWFVFSMLLTRHRSGQKEGNGAMFFAMFILLLTAANDIIVVSFGLKWIYLGDLGYIGIIAVMSAKLSSNVVRLTETEKMLRVLEVQRQAIFNSVSHFSGLLDIRGRILDANEAALKFIGSSLDELRGMPFGDAPWWNDLPEEREKLADATARALKGETVHFETRHTDARGERRVIDFTLRPLADEDGVITHMVPEGRDITEMHEAREEIQRQNVKLEQANQEINATNEELQAAIEELEATNEEFQAQNEELMRSQEELRQSEVFIRRIVENAPAVINRYSLIQNRFEFVSPRVRDMGGFSPEEFYNDPDILRKFVHPDWFKRVMKWWGGLVRGTSGPTFEYQIRKKDGTDLWVREHSQLITDETGRPVAIEGFTIDIDDSKKSETRLKESEEKYRGLVESINDIIFTADSQGRLTYLSPSVSRYGEFSADDIIGKSMLDVIHPEDREKLVQRFGQLSTGELTPSEYRIVFPSGGFRWARVSTRPVFVDGAFAGAGGVISDIHERKLAEQSLVEEGLRVDRQRAALAALSNDPALYAGDTIESLKKIAEEAASAMQTRRVGIWFLSDDGEKLHCIDTFDADTRAHSGGAVLEAGDYPRYFEAIKQYSRISAPDVISHPHTGEFIDSYLAPLEITSMLDAGISIEGKLLGVVCFEHTGEKREWHTDDESFASTIASIVAQILINDRRKLAEEALSESESKFRDLAEKSLVGIYMYQDGLFVYVNSEFASIFGYVPDEIINRLGLGDVIFPEDLPRVQENIRARLSGEEQSKRYEFRAHTKSRETRNIEVYGTISSFRGRPSIIGTVVDVTERKKAEVALRDSEEKYRSLVENISEIIYSADKDGKFTYISPASERIGGYRPDEMTGADSFSFIHPDDLAAVVEDSKALRDGVIKPSEYRVRTKNGDYRWIMSTSRPIFKDGQFMGSSGILTDITERKTAELENARMQKQLLQAQKMEAVGTLAGGIAHDFNNMLGGIMGSLNLVELLLEKDEAPPRETIMSYVETALESSRRAADMTRQLLTLSRKSELKAAPVDITLSMKHVYKLCRNSFPKSVDLDFRIGDHPLRVQADPAQIEQVLLNLCVNASHAMTIMRAPNERQGGTLSVSADEVLPDDGFCALHTEAVREHAYTLIRVSDTGVGMDEKTRSRIFDPFFTAKKQSEGTGLGLAMAYGIVKQHGGFIEVYSEPGRGSTFTVYLPTLTDGAPDAAQKKATERMARGAGTILVIDDERAILSIARGMLEQCGYKVITAEGAVEGLEIYHREMRNIDGVLLDLSMPEMSGLEIYARMESINPGVKALMASGLMESDEVRKALALGVKGFIQKPYTAEELSVKMKEALS